MEVLTKIICSRTLIFSERMYEKFSFETNELTHGSTSLKHV